MMILQQDFTLLRMGGLPDLDCVEMNAPNLMTDASIVKSKLKIDD